MFLASFVAWMAIQIDCPDEFSKIGKRNWIESAKTLLQKVGLGPSRIGISSRELAQVLSLPTDIDGEVATLVSEPELKIFAVSDLEKTRLEFVSIYAFSKFPLPVATIYLDKKPASKPDVHFEYGESTAYLALQSQPKLINLLQRYGYLRFSDKDLPALHRMMRAFLEMELTKAERLEYVPKRLDEIRDAFLRLEVSRLNNEAIDRPVKFGGWLPGDSYALAIVEDVFMGLYPGRRVYLNPQTRGLYHSSWPDIKTRIEIEGRFLLSWLNLRNPVVIEMDREDNKRAQYLIFPSESNLPRGLPFYRIDPKTGLRIGQKPTILARPLERD